MPGKSTDSNRLNAHPTLRELEVFRSVIVCGKTTAAAEQLGISQPAVSRTLTQLEARRGETLFRREGNRLIPTEEALALNQELEPVFEVLARVALSSRGGDQSATIRIFAPASFSQYFLPALITGFVRREERCAVHLEIGSTPSAVASIASGLADLAVTNSPVSHAGVRLEPFRRSLACCLMPSGHRLARREIVGPRDLQDEPFIALARRFASRSAIDRLFQTSGVHRRIVAEAATAVAAMALVREGLGLSILNPFPISESTERAVTFRRFTPDISYESSFVLPIAKVKPGAKRFIDYVRCTQMNNAYSTVVN